MTVRDIIEEVICRIEIWRVKAREEAIRRKERRWKLFGYQPETIPRGKARPRIPIESKQQYNDSNTNEGAMLGRGMGVNV